MQTKELIKELEETRLQISHTLQACLQSDGKRRYATPWQQIATYNRRVKPELLDSLIHPYVNPPNRNIVIGDDIIQLDPNGEFNVHFPIRRGDFNLHDDIGGSMTSILADLQEIWECALETHLKIPLRYPRYTIFVEF